MQPATHSHTHTLTLPHVPHSILAITYLSTLSHSYLPAPGPLDPDSLILKHSLMLHTHRVTSHSAKLLIRRQPLTHTSYAVASREGRHAACHQGRYGMLPAGPRTPTTPKAVTRGRAWQPQQAAQGDGGAAGHPHD